MELNQEQLLAVRHPIGAPAVLLAGAGSGKTRVMTERVRWLMEQGVLPRKICCLTFTNKAAGELLSRLDLNQTEYNIPRVSTIHALALSGIRKNSKAFGLDEKITPLDEYDQVQLMKKVIERYDLKHSFKAEREKGFVYALLEKIGFHRARGVGFRNEYTKDVHERAEREHAGYHAMTDEFLDLWEMFEADKSKASLIDFDDMLWLFNRRARTDTAWLKRVQAQFEHVLVDEAQDLSKVQWQFIYNLLASDNPNLYCVGDLSQSIFGFQGAAPKLMKDYSEDWRGNVPAMYKLRRNHRSLKTIVQLANKIQTTMTETISLEMIEFREEAGEWKLIIGDTPQSVAYDIAAKIKQDARHKNPILFKENAILVRSAIQMFDLEGELVRRRIPYVVRGGMALIKTEEVRDILAYFRLVTNHKDFTAFMRCCSVPRCGVGEVALNKLRIEANQENNGDLLEAAKKNNNLHNLVGIIEQIEVFKETPIIALEKFFSLFDYRAYITKKYSKDKDKARAKLENIERFIMMITSLTSNKTMTLDDLIFQMALDRSKGDETEKELYERQLATGELTQDQYDVKMEEIKNGYVTISTMHSSKGLEWGRVFIPNLYENSLPHIFSLGSPQEIEEERRLFYVACTRARNILILYAPKRIPVRNSANYQRCIPSRFLSEIDALTAILSSTTIKV